MAVLWVCSATGPMFADPEPAATPPARPLFAPRPLPRLLFPANCVILEQASFEVIAVAPESEEGNQTPPSLHIDDEAHPWAPAAPPALVAHACLQPGRHTLRIGDDEAIVFVAGGDAEPPKDWPVLRRHPLHGEGADRCAACHGAAASGATPAYPPPPPGEGCVNCHTAEQFAITHEHVEPPLRNCAMCHSVHGALHDALLKAPAKKLCAGCHD